LTATAFHDSERLLDACFEDLAALEWVLAQLNESVSKIAASLAAIEEFLSE